jgi:hypothetical protein
VQGHAPLCRCLFKSALFTDALELALSGVS